jgi:pyruvate formate lyase activating enzyme
MSQHLDQEKALIFEIKGNSLDDGPGIRTVIFFKGCPLRCVWCHNPESIRKAVEISFDKKECIGCDACIKICPSGALDRAAPYFIDASKCTLCMKCFEVCPSEALSQVGKLKSMDEIMREIRKDLPFFRTSGGGVTLSGGEPTLHMDFCACLLREVKSLGVSSLIETCGLFDLDRFKACVYPNLDIIYFDIKLMDDVEHERFCGTSNRRILENFEHLFALGLDGGAEVIPRIPLVPDITATSRNLTAIASYLGGFGVKKVELLQYNPLWMQKLEKICLSSDLANKDAMRTWMTPDALKACREIFRGFEMPS